MRVLPLYERLPRSPVEASERLQRDPACTRCELSKGVTTVCVPAAGKPGGLLVVGEGPGQQEDLDGRPFTGRSGAYLREQVARWWSGPVAVTNATNCAPIKNKDRDAVDVEAAHVDACRPFLAHTLDRAKPTRVVCVGAHAARAITGRAVPPTKTRRGYAYLFWTRLPDALRDRAERAANIGDVDASDGFQSIARAAEVGECHRANWDIAVEAAVPVFFLLHPAAALRNEFMRQAFEEDLQWALTCEPPPKPPVEAFFEVVETADDDEDAARMLAAGPVFFDIEAGGEQWAPSYRVVSIAASVPDRAGDASSAVVWSAESLNAPNRSARLRAWLADPKVAKGGSNVQYDINGLAQIGIATRGVRRDVRLSRKLLSPDASGYLDDMADLVGMGGYKKGAAEDAANELAERLLSGLAEEKLRAKHAELVAQGKYKKPPKRPSHKGEHLEAWLAFKAADPEMAAFVERDPSWGARWSWVYAAMARYAPDTLHRYNAFDVVVEALLDAWLDAELARVPRLLNTWVPIVSAMPEVVAHIERWGMRANEAAVRAFDAFLVSKIEPIEQRLAAYTSVTNWNSTQQVAKLLYGELGLKPPKKTDGGADSTDASALKALKGRHPIIDDLMEHSRYTDLRKTFACGSDGKSGMLPFIKPDGRMHPHILMDGTATGRSSCNSPNLYNIPAKKYPIEGKMARDIFVATPGSVIVSVDWSQIQLRLAAHLSGDDVMREIFTSGVDFHRRTAELIAPLVWKIRPEDVTDEHRAHAKNFNFGLLFGMGDHALACRMYDTQDPTKEQVAMAGKIRAAVLGAFKKLATWIEREVEKARRTGMVVSQLDGRLARHRYVWDIADRDKGRRGHAEREVVNCLDAETEALTQRGWVRGFDLTPDDVLLTKDPLTGALEWQRPISLHMFPDYEGPLVEFKSKAFNAVSTLNHRWLTRRKYDGRDAVRTTASLNRSGNDRIHRTGRYSPDIVSAITPDEAELLGWFVTDGSVRRARPGGYTADRAFLHQSKAGNPEKCARIAALLHRLDGDGEVRRYAAKGGEYLTWYLGRRLSALMLEFAPKRTLMPAVLLRLGREALDRLRDAMMLGDGTRSSSKDVFSTGRREQAEAFQMLCTLTGNAASIVCRDMSRYSPKSAKLSNVPKMGSIWLVTILRRDTAQVTASQRREFMAKVGVWCPTVPHGFFVARRRGTVFITGNSPIQAEEAGMMHRSTIAVVRWIWACGFGDAVKVLLPLYDQLLMDVRRDLVDEVVETVPDIMTSWPCSVPLVADVEIGLGWGSLHKMKRSREGWACHVRDEKVDGDKRSIWTPPFASALSAFDEAQRMSG